MNTTKLSLTNEELKDLSTITLHFDVRDAEGNDKHSIPLDQFVKTAEAVRMIINDFNRSWFDNKLPIELHMPALEEGGVIINIHKWIKENTGTAAIYASAIFPTSGFLLYPLAKNIRNIIYNPEKWDKLLELISSWQPIDTNEIPLCALTMAALAFIAIRNEDLIEAGINPKNMREAFKGKNKLIEAADANLEIKGIGFDTSDNFTILRADFKNYISDIPPEQTIDNQPTEEITPQIEIVDIQVEGTHSDYETDEWKTKAKLKKDAIKFVIKDEGFWQWWRNELSSGVPFSKMPFEMKVQWIFIEKEGKKKDVKVLRVLSLEGKKISFALTEEEKTKNIGFVQKENEPSQIEMDFQNK